MSVKRGAPAPAVVGSHFVKQYYGEVLSKKPVELHRFYKDESTFCHASGTKEEEPVSGLADIKAKIEHLGLGGATVDLGCGSVDAQPSEGGGVLLMVTGSITITDRDPRQFVQTFFLARQHQNNDRHNYFVRNDIFRFLDVLPEVVQAAMGARDDDESAPRSAAGDLESSVETVEAVEQQQPQQPLVEVEQEAGDSGASSPQEVIPDVAPSVATPSSMPQPSVSVSSSPVVSVVAPDTPPGMMQGMAPASEPQSTSPAVPAGAAAPQSISVGNTACQGNTPLPAPAHAGSVLDNGTGGKALPAKTAPATASVGSPSQSASVASASRTMPDAVQSAPVTVPAPTLPLPPPAAPTPAASPPAPAEPTTYASLAKSWATVAAVGGEAASPSLGAAGGAPASSSSVGIGSAGIGSVGSSGNGNPAPASNGGWGLPDPVVAMSGSGSGVEQSGVGLHAPIGGQGSLSSRSSSCVSTKGGQKNFQYNHIPHHASPAVAASAAAAREAAAAGNGEILPATSLFVRKVDMSIERDDMIAHFSAYGDVTGISMNPNRGYAFIDYRNNECVLNALSTTEHYVNRKLLVVEERHSTMQQRNSRGEHGGRGGRNGGRGRGSGGRDGRDADRGDRRNPGGRAGRGMMRGERPDGSGPKDGGYKVRARVEPA